LRVSLFLFLRVDVPDFGEERRQFFVFELEREAHLRVEVAQSAQLGEDRQELGELGHGSHAVIHDVGLQRLQVDLLDLLHFACLHQARPLGEDDDGGEEGVFCVVDFHVAHLLAEPEERLGRITDAGHVVRVARVRQIVGENDAVRVGVVSPGTAQHHHFARTRFEECDLILSEEGIETGQSFGKLDRQLYRQDRHLGDVLELGLAVRFVNS